MIKSFAKFVLFRQFRIHSIIQYISDKKKPLLIRRLLINILIKKYNISVGTNTVVGKNLVLPHQFNVVIGDGAVIGERCTIYHNVTIGQNKGKYPVIGNNVIIYTGAVIIGAVRIGDNSIIGAGSIVTKDVPENTIVSGNPASILKKREVTDEFY